MKTARPADLRRACAALSFVAVVMALLTSMAAVAQSRPARPQRSIFIAAASDAMWLVRPAAVREKDPPKWTVLRRLASLKDDKWGTVASLAQQPTAVATFGDRLAVLYADGTWSLVSGSGQMNGLPAPVTMKLENVATAGDKLIFLASLRSGDPTPYLIEFDGSALSEPRPAANIEIPSADVRLVTTPAGVGFVVADEKSRIIDDVAQSSDGQWHAFRRDDTVMLAFAGIESAPVNLPPAALAGRLTLSRDGDGNPRFWWIEADRAWSQAFNLDGSARGDPVEVIVRPPPQPPLFERALYVVGAVTLLVVLLAGGKQTLAVTRALAQRSPPTPAPLARRFAAGVIDCLPIAATATYLASGGKLSILAGMLRFDSHRSEAILAAGVLLYLTLLVACELRWQQSVGKLLFALRVVSIDGETPRPRAILIRNILRLVDLNLITLLIVPATPLRQRLGDFLAGTMVVDASQAKSSRSDDVTPDDPADKT